MIEEKYEKKDGSEGVKYKIENGDVVTARFDKPLKHEGGKYPNYSIGATKEDGTEIFLTLTETQFNQLEKVGNLTGKKLEGYEYESKKREGKFTGIRVKQ